MICPKALYKYNLKGEDFMLYDSKIRENIISNPLMPMACSGCGDSCQKLCSVGCSANCVDTCKNGCGSNCGSACSSRCGYVCASSCADECLNGVGFNAVNNLL